MAKFISIFNNKGGVGKTTLTWNLADTLAEKGKRVLLIDFDPQCNLSIAMLGSDSFKGIVSQPTNSKTIRGFLQGYLQSTGPGSVHIYSGPNTHPNVQLIAGDFWLNVYSDALSVGNDLLTGNGIAKFTALRTLEDKLKTENGLEFDYVMIDLPPSFGGLVRSALYSSDYLLIPCTSDTFSEYCIGLIAQMLPQFISDWETGVKRYKENNYASTDFDTFGKPRYAGWIFNGFDTRSGRKLRADQAHFENIDKANSALASALKKNIATYDAALSDGSSSLNIGSIEDMNVLMQNSLWLSVPVAKLRSQKQVQSLSGDKTAWSDAQIKLIGEIGRQLSAAADNVINHLG